MKKSYILLIFLISSFLIFHKFNQIPKNLDKDEVEFAKLTLSLDKKPYTPYTPFATGHSTLYFYIILLSFKIFGISNFSLRFLSALFGLINPIIFYLILIEILKILKIKNYSFFSFLGTIILTTSHWYFNFARFSYEATFLLFLELTSIYFLIKWYLKNKNIFLIFSGIFSGLTFNSYIPGRIFFILPVFFLIYQTINSHINKQFNNLTILTIKQLIYFLIPFIITILPLTLYLLKNNDIRFQQQFFLSNSDLSFGKKLQFLGENIQSIVLMYSFKGDVNGRHNYPFKPALNPFLSMLLYLGLFFCIKNFKNLFNQFFIFYFLLSQIPAILTYPWENPNMLRTFTALPSISFFSIVGFYQLKKFVSKKYPKFKLFLSFFLFIFLILSFFYEIRTYFKYQAKVFDKAFEVNKKLEEIIKLKNL
ncbi:MAG: glycosyltransferase family 39 protein [Microgenomates group bacterium]